MLTNHGDIVCYTRAGMAPEQSQLLPAYKMFEVLAVYLHGASLNLLVVVIYRPSTTVISSTFFDEFDDALERTATFSSAIAIVGISTSTSTW